MVSNNISILNTFQDLTNYLTSGLVNNPFTLYSQKYVINHEQSKYHGTENPYHSIRIWKTNTLCNFWYNDQHSSSFVAALDYQIRPNDLRIEYLNVNDDECCYKEKPITQHQARMLHSYLLDYVKDTAKKENKSKVIVDVHQNFRIFNKDYLKEGFKTTGRRCKDNPYWQEIELDLVKEINKNE